MEEFGLNIIADATAAVAPKPPKKKKRLNKYDKRRRKSARAKLEEQQKIQQQEEGSLEAPQRQDEHGSDGDGHDDLAMSCPVATSLMTETEQVGGLEEALNASDDGGNDQDDYGTPAIVQEQQQPKATSEEEASHAAYMAEFHARPLELDRRSGARALQRLPRNNSEETKKNSTTWTDLYGRWHPKLQAVLAKEYTHPTAIQARVFRSLFPNTQQREDHKLQPHVWIQSETGSGKTLAYFVPLFQRLLERITAARNSGSPMTRQSLGTACLIVCPTQELVQQTHAALQAVVNQCCAGTVVVGSLMGQESRSKEKARVRKGLGVLVSTPGRLLDHLQTTMALQTALLHKLQWVVLDEVDRLFDLGLAPQLTQVLELVAQYTKPKTATTAGGPTWQSVLVSATVPPAVRTQVQECLSSTSNAGEGGNNGKREWSWIQNDEDSSRDSEDEDHQLDNTMEDGTRDETRDRQQRSLPKQLVQYHVTVSAKLRLSTLVAFLLARIPNKERTVVFLSTCASVDYYHALFQAMDCIYEQPKTKTTTTNTSDAETEGIFGAHCPVYKLHGNVPHAQRHQVLQDFVSCSASSSSRVLLATDVAARGLNLKTDWTVQYDPPCEIADYIHRAGRVARAGQAGQSVLFLLPSERGLLPLLGRLQLQKQLSELPLKEAADLADGGSDMMALSLASTLQLASRLSPRLTRDGVARNGGGRSKGSDQSIRHDGGSCHRDPEAFCAELQYRLEECVLQQSALAAGKQVKRPNAKQGGKHASADPAVQSLLEMARNAFLAYMRAYPTKEKLVRHIFSARALHLGHIAKSFALREPPTVLVRNSKKQQQQLAMVQLKAKHGKKATSPNKGKKRNAVLAFGRTEETVDYQMKDASKARALLMANAAKLQLGGVDGF